MSCVDAGSGGKRKTATANQGATTDDVDDSNSDETLNAYWFFNGQKVEGTITINQNVQTVAYLRGKTIHNFLNTESNAAKKYCLVGSYQDNTVTKNTLNVRAVPIVITNFTTKSIERLLRIDLIDESVNSSQCAGPVSVLDVNGEVDITRAPNPGFAPTTICPSCTSAFTTSNISLYEYSSLSINDGTKVDPSLTGLATTNLRVNPTNTTTDPVSSCSNSECIAKGFNCCLEGQCVNDASVKPNIDPLSTEFLQAKAEVEIDPLNFLKWPNIYFICPNIVRPEPQDPVITDPNPGADERFQALLKQYNCLTGAENPEGADYSACEPTFDDAAYDTIKNDVWDQCGCEAVGAEREVKCPDFGLKPVLNTNDEIVEIICKIPPPPSDPTPVQYTNEPVSVRSVPHRFFDTTGKLWDDLTKIDSASVVQEGQSFSYTDTSGKTDPTPTQFSMNAILGPMNVQLTGAVPAKQLDVEFDQVYVISVNSGYYTPCPQCADDAWFSTFKSRPPSYNGTGLQAVGHSTSRDAYDNNTNAGNYEDTIFGRACWLPPTMIPFSHAPNNNLKTQRMNRLITQSALYVNGYQRDWYGFNQGALIGSFNGVNWFAIGKGRRVTSTSNKLYLAINGAYADLADKTDLLVNVVTDQGGGTAADYDYDPNLELNDSRQNQGASCQEAHQCQVDSDCVTKLGWEYVCADVNQHKSKWPKFNLNGDEQAGQENESLSFNQIIFGVQPASASSKRCVYRGSGSVCSSSRTDLGSASKLFQCAPNFYCAKMDESEFNSEVVRTPNLISNILFGQEADVLGRPMYYLGGNGTQSLESNLSVNPDGTLKFNISTPPESIVLNQIKHNMAAYFSNNEADVRLNDIGVCRPGKDITQGTQEQMQQSKDSLGRTDYISQISSCDSTATNGTLRARACPVFDANGDYVNSPQIEDVNEQNMCGGESVSTINGTPQSVFFEVEALDLGALPSLIDPRVVQNACLRKAGAICQTNLDCGPGKLHAETALFYDQSHFGDTEAEHKFWQEGLICGQAQKKPSFNSDNFNSYDMSQNRCCRETGATLTMFTEGPTSLVPSNVSSNNAGSELTVTRYPQNGPSANGRYSRYSIVTAQDNLTAAITSAITTDTAINQAPIVATAAAPKAFQWKTINDTAQRTCCGRGWVRKFADGSNDWGNSSRLNINPSDFNCLNTQSKLPFTNNPEADLSVNNENYYGDFSKLCQSPADNGGCIQRPIIKSNEFEITNPTHVFASTFTLSTLPDENPSSGTLLQVNGLSSNIPYMPTPLRHGENLSSEGPYNYFHNSDFHLAIRIIIPAYISVLDDTDMGSITDIKVKRIKDGSSDFTSSLTAKVPITCDGGAQAENSYCLREVNGKIALDIRVSPEQTGGPDDATDDNNFDYAGLEIDFINQNTLAATSDDYPLNSGNDLYYLTKLARLELLGIPQIVYEPLYCNSDRSQLIGGIYNQTTRAGFNANSFDYNASNENGRNISAIYDSPASDNFANPGRNVVNADQIIQNQVWSDNEFMCCLNLGEETDDPGLCCSGFAPDPGSDSTSTDTKRTCKLPSGTNLNVYFNKFVSGDGMGEDQPGGGLEDSDFVPETGEIKLNSTAYSKVRALGSAYCGSGEIRGGAAFGYFYAEPNTGNYFQNGSLEDSKMWSITDSNLDYDDANDNGFVRFLEGYRWNHHTYCK